jgi:hypothetical protein
MARAERERLRLRGGRKKGESVCCERRKKKKKKRFGEKKREPNVFLSRHSRHVTRDVLAGQGLQDGKLSLHGVHADAPAARAGVVHDVFEKAEE